jgi:hypothetical protein
MVVVTLSGVPSVGGRVTCGRTGWILAVTKTSLTRDVMMELLPTPSSPQRHIRTVRVSGRRRVIGRGTPHTGRHFPAACYCIVRRTGGCEGGDAGETL